MQVTQTIAGFEHQHHDLDTLMRDKIHYGCGNHLLDDWLNVDGFDGSYPYEGIDQANRPRILPLDIAGRHPFEDAVFSYGYSEHMIEHLSQADSLSFLSEAYRTLMPDGVLRLCFPGLAGVLKRHYRSSDFDGARKGKEEAYTNWGHLHFYAFESLSLVARHIGFRNVEEREHGKSEHNDLRDLESRKPKEDGFELLVELTK